MGLKEKLIELGEKNKDLQQHIFPILKEVESGGFQVDKNEMENPDTRPDGNIDDGKYPEEPKSEDGGILSTSPHALKAFKEVILPQIQMRADSASFGDFKEMMDEMEALGSSQNKGLEKALIVHKPISKNTRNFYGEIKKIFYDWLKPKMQGKEEIKKEDVFEEDDGDAKKEYNFNFS